MSGQEEIIKEQLACALIGSDLPGLGVPERRGITDTYSLEDYTLLIVTDRAGNNDAVSSAIPFKGEVIARLSAWWLDQMRDLVPNTIERVVDPQALLVRRAAPVPVGFSAHARLSESVVAPMMSEPAGRGNAPVTRDQALEEPGMSPELFDRMSALAHKLFERGRALAAERQIELVDTCYSFGLLPGGELVVDTLLHAPHLSSYRIAGPDGRSWQSPGETVGAAGELPQERCLELAEAYLTLGQRLIADFEPHVGPVKNRLAYSLSFVGLLA